MRSSVIASLSAAVILSAAPLCAQTIISPSAGSTVQVDSAKDYATWAFQDPWDMNERTDLGWFTFGSDQPSANLSSWSFSSGVFTAVPKSGVNSDPDYADPSIWLLDTYNPGSAVVGRTGKKYPIDTSKYRILMLRMRLNGLPAVKGSLGPYIAQVFWSNNTIYSDQTNGGFHESAGIPVYSGWWIYYIDLNSLSTINGTTTWPNSPSNTVDSLRFDPVQYLATSFDIDWVRLTNLDATLNQTINWTGGAPMDVFLSTASGCSNPTKIGSSKSSPFSYYVGGLPPGDYYVGIGTPGVSAPTICSTGKFQVLGVPTMTFTSPSEEGSADDFATVQLNDAWDMASVNDIDYYRNITGLGVSSITAETEAGTSLGSISVLSGTSTPGTAETGNVGDPHVYPMWLTKRGLDYRLDATRYRIFTAEAGVQHARDVAGGSIARVFWHVAGDSDAQGALENETADIVLHNLGTANVLEKLNFDMTAIGLETDPGRRSSMGWVNGSTSNPGIDAFRFDPHEFAAATGFFIKRIKLAARERASSTYTIKWSFTNPTSRTGTTVSLYRDTTGSGFAGTEIIGCQDLDPTTGSTGCTWNMSSVGLTSGTAYYIYAQIKSGATVINQTYAKWPIVYDTSYVANQPRITLDRTILRHTAVKTGCTLTYITQPQDVRLAKVGSGTISWTVASSQPWVTVSPASGTTGGTFTVSLADYGGGCGSLPASTGQDGLDAVIKVTATGVTNSPQYIHHYATIYAPGGTTVPYGQVDTPAQSASGVVGAIGVTGWALDDVGVSNVKIYRNCLAFENQASCQVIGGYNVVYVGDAAFLAGARPDVETAFPTAPYGYRAGWGYLMLTNMLPDVTNSQAYGGQGTLTIYAYATDQEGNTTLMGRSQADQTPTTITMANATIAKPFGAIDTPGQGQTVSGTLANFGWALTPDSNTSADATDIVIPTNGSTMVVFLDGVSTALVAYNQCRGNVGNPVPAGLYCNDDVANIFGNTTPKATLTARTSNPTKYRNLDATRAAIGAYNIDTTAMTNGLHTIAWSVTDSAGRNEGIGSRFFIVFNGSGDQAAAVQALADAPARAIGQATDVTWRPLADGEVWGRAGFDLRAPWEILEPNAAGTRHVRMPELGRLELSLGPGVSVGYLMANGTLRSLPVGSQLSDGHFTWAPPVGYVGTYDLVFVNGIEQVPVSVTIHAASEQPRIQAYIDLPRAGDTVRGAFTVAGWAADQTAWSGTGVGAVHVWAHRRDADVAPVFLGAADLNGWRPDVGVTLGGQFEHAGWGLVAPALPPGEYDLVAYFWSLKTQRFEDARVVRLRAR